MAINTFLDITTGVVHELDDGKPEPPPSPPTIDDYRAAITAHLDAVAQSRGYDSQLTIAIHATSTVPQWAAEAQAFIAWKDAVWLQVHALWTDPPDPPPSPAELLASLPEIIWPEAQA